jgi:hypothetical protein
VPRAATITPHPPIAAAAARRTGPRVTNGESMAKAIIGALNSGCGRTVSLYM